MTELKVTTDRTKSQIVNDDSYEYFNESLINGFYNYSLPNADEIIYLVNATRQVPYEYAVVLLGYIMPFLLIITIVANTLIVVVLSQRHMRTPTNLVLLAMAIADLMTLLFPAPWYFYIYTLGNHDKILYPPSSCYAYHCMIEVIPAFFHTASIWLTILLAGQRYIYVCHITTARTWCTVPRVTKAMAVIFLAALLHQSTRFADRHFEAVRFRWNNSTQVGCQFFTAKWVSETITEDIYYICYYGFRVIFVHIGPCVVLVILNVLLFKELKKAQRKRAKLFAENRRSECIKLRDSNSTTIMLIVIVTVFLAVEIPLAVTTFLHVMQNAIQIRIVEYDLLNTTVLFTNFFIILSYPVNFAIYCGMSRQFRQTFKDLFLYQNLVAINLTVHKEGSSRHHATNGPHTSNETIL